jgi:hypothetical protein
MTSTIKGNQPINCIILALVPVVLPVLRVPSCQAHLVALPEQQIPITMIR